jgi:prefoldin subunit 2
MESERKCFRMVGGVLTERTVGHVLPALEETQTGVPPPLSKRANRMLIMAAERVGQ